MKKMVAFVLAVAVLVSVMAISALASGNSALQSLSDDELIRLLLAELESRNGTGSGSSSMVLRSTTENGKIPTRSGPSTKYTEPGSFSVIGKDIRIISRADDAGGVCWLQCEVPVGSTYRRLYTGLRRFEPVPASFDIYSVPLERPLNYRAKVSRATPNLLYGPGGNYGSYGSKDAHGSLKKGAIVTIIALENGYAQVEWKAGSALTRAWILESSLEY